MYKSAMGECKDITQDLLQNHFPVHWACFNGNEAYLRQLLMSGRIDDIYQEDGLHAWTPMHWAAFRGQWKCLELIGEFYHLDLDVTTMRYNQSLAHITAQNNQAECLTWLMQRGVSLGIQDHMGDTPLHKAALTGCLNCVRLLISHGTLLSTFNNKSQTPLEVAIQHGHTECKNLLEQAMCSQHTGFFPSSSSPILMNGEGPILMNGEGIYLNGVSGGNEPSQDMDMGEEMSSDGDAAVVSGLQATGGCKRSFDDDEETTFKRRRLFVPSFTEKMGTENNNSVVSSYQGVLGMSVEPLKPPMDHLSNNNTQEVHAIPTPRPPGVTTSGTSSIMDHCSALYAQADYDSTMLSLLNSDYGY